jgi:uncharacterized protein with HEPN domain
MTQHDPLLRLRHMLDHAREAVEMVRGRERRDLDRDRMLELSLVRLVEIVGEAASRMTRADQARYPTIPWPQVTGMRHRLVHGYDTVDLQVLWDTVTDDLPPLIAALEAVLGLESEQC